MPLYVPGDRQHPISSVPNRLLFNSWKSRLEALEIRAIDIELDRLVRSKRGGEINTAHFLPREISPHGHRDWAGTPLWKIWDKACERDAKHACWCFGLLLWEHMTKRPEAWHFKTGDLEDIPMAATKYYHCPPAKPVEGRRPAVASS